MLLILLLGLYLLSVDADFLPEPCSADLCYNGGICYPGPELNTSWCSCPEEVYGNRCERTCECLNGGKCNYLDASCSCPLGFSGDICEVKLNTVCSGKRKPCGDREECHLTTTLKDYECRCKEGWKGPNCSTHCPAGYCRNNGTCYLKNTVRACTCTDGFEGDRCEKDIDECGFSGICGHGRCENTFGSYECHCDVGYAGRNCERKIEDGCRVSGINSCENGGYCQKDGLCLCPPMYKGQFCEQDVDECLASPCHHGGTCMNTYGGFSCICTFGWEGKTCLTNIDDCLFNNCSEGSTCVDGIAKYTCKCPVGRIGFHCEVHDQCSSNPCGHGICETDFDTGEYSCICDHGYTGHNCSTDINECEESNTTLCYNDGICINTPGGFKCRCAPDFSGKQCEQQVNDCTSNSCLNQGSCIDDIDSFICKCKTGYGGNQCELICPVGLTGFNCSTPIVSYKPPKEDLCDRNPCQHSGACIDDGNSYHCLCTEGYSGQNCELPIDFCSNITCINGGQCSNENFGSCYCPNGYEGARCEHKTLNKCHPNPCLNRGKCTTMPNDYSCICPKGYTGKNCQSLINVDIYSEIDRNAKNLCLNAGCEKLASNGVCDYECNHFGCNYDGGDCSARVKPFDRCSAPSYCAHVFKDGKCDQVCNNKECLFDGFDCVEKAPKCPSDISQYCELRSGDGQCDPKCNRKECGFDGGDCEADIVFESLGLVVLGEPSVYLKKTQLLLAILSQKLHTSVQFKTDEYGPMIFEWLDGKQGNRLQILDSQVHPVDYAVRRYHRQATLRGVIFFIEMNTKDCTSSMCFQDINSVASYIGALSMKQELSNLGLPIYEAMVNQAPTQSEEANYTGFYITCIIVVLMMLVVLVVLQRRTRRRRTIHAPCWMIPPLEPTRSLLMLSEKNLLTTFCDNDDLYKPKKPRIDPMSFYSHEYISATNRLVHRIEPPVPAKKVFVPGNALQLEADSENPIRTPIDKSMVNEKGPSGRTALHFLVDSANKSEETILEDISKLLDAGADLDAQDDYEETALFIATRRHCTKVVVKLLELNADPTIMNNQDSTCLHMACRNCDVKMTEELLKSKAVVKEIDVCDFKNRTPLMMAAMNDTSDTTIVEMLVKAGADILSSGDKEALTIYTGRTAMHFAAEFNNIVVLKYLIEKGANKDAQDSEDQTPLFIAASQFNLEAVRVLVEAGASVDIVDQKDRSPRDIAAENHYDEVIKILDSSVSIPLPIHITGTQKHSQKPIKRIAVRRKPQPLTPPHSDISSTPTPPQDVNLTTTTIVKEENSPDINGNSPINVQTTLPSLPSWNNISYPKTSPPYEFTDLDNSNQYHHLNYQKNFSVPSYPSCQYSRTHYVHHV